jgi:hypothetical protein
MLATFTLWARLSWQTLTDRKLIVDGQQRITTTPLRLVAIRDRLNELNQPRAAQSGETDHLSNYILAEEQTVADSC